MLIIGELDGLELHLNEAPTTTPNSSTGTTIHYQTCSNGVIRRIFALPAVNA